MELSTLITVAWITFGIAVPQKEEMNNLQAILSYNGTHMLAPYCGIFNINAV